MRRFRRSLFFVAFVLWLATAALWVQSWSVPLCLTIERDLSSPAVLKVGEDTRQLASFYSMRGGLDVRLHWWPGNGPKEQLTQPNWSLSRVYFPMRLNEMFPKTVWQRLGFTWTPVPSGRSHRLNLGFPYWLPFAVLQVPFAWWLPKRLKRQRSSGCCTRCGYDLRATPDRCPECGTVPAG